MARKSPNSKEIKIAVAISTIIVVFLFLPSIIGALSSGQFAPSEGPALAPATAPNPFFVNNQNQAVAVTATATSFGYNAPSGSATEDGRVVATSEALVGYVKHGGEFQNVTGLILQELNANGGFVNSSNLMYNGTTWYGVWLVDVPPTNATAFLFVTSDLINQNGNTTSINIQTQDVTGQTGGNRSSVPYSPFSVTIQELASNNVVQNHPAPAFGGVLSSVVSILTVLLDGTIYILAIGVPTFFLVLGGVLVSRRLLYPILLRASGRSSGARQEESSRI
jgi:hypothetical protein